MIQLLNAKKKGNKLKKKYKYEKDNEKKFSFYKIKNLIHKNNIKTHNYHNHIHHRNYGNKITITNDNFEENSKLRNNLRSMNYHLNNKRKNLILNNTSNNINININITNINEKNSDKKNTDSSGNKKPEEIIPEKNNNFSNNITTVNIINNNNFKTFNKKKIFFNRSNKKFSNLNKIKPGIKIQSININLGEELNKRNSSFNNKNKNLRNKDKFNSNFLSDKSIKFKEPDSDKKETQSEYEHFRDCEDFLSNRSLSNYSWKSGFTASRRLRNLKQERNKIKLINIKEKNENDIDKIEDKLLNIVSNFHKNNTLSTSRVMRKSFKGKRKNLIKGKDFQTINTGNRKWRLKK